MMNRKMLKQAQEMQKRLAAVQKEIASAESTASAGGGAVTAVVIGGTRLERLEISPDVVDPEDVELLQDLIIAAINEAMDQAQQSAADKMGEITGGLNIPGLGF